MLRRHPVVSAARDALRLPNDPSDNEDVEAVVAVKVEEDVVQSVEEATNAALPRAYKTNNKRRRHDEIDDEAEAVTRPGAANPTNKRRHTEAVDLEDDEEEKEEEYKAAEARARRLTHKAVDAVFDVLSLLRRR